MTGIATKGSGMAETITVTDGGNTSIQDLGRLRASRIGQLTGGALDQYSAEVATALVGVPRTAPLLELVALGFGAVASTHLLIAITGAPADVPVAGVTRPQWEPFLWPAGRELTIRGIHDGLRVYLAVHGSIRADTLLGSCAPDPVLGFGRHLSVGDSVAVEVDGPPIDHVHFRIPLFRFGVQPPVRTGNWTIDVTDGPDIHEFGATAGRLFDTPFTIGKDSNHIGLRLTAAHPRQPNSPARVPNRSPFPRRADRRGRSTSRRRTTRSAPGPWGYRGLPGAGGCHGNRAVPTRAGQTRSACPVPAHRHP